MLKHKRLVSIIATIAFCLSFLAPALIAPAPAVAASSIQALTVPTVVDEASQQLGNIKVTVSAGSIASGDTVIVKLPTDWDWVDDKGFNSSAVATATAGTKNEIVVPAKIAGDPNGLTATNLAVNVVSKNEVRITATNDQALDYDFVFYIFLGSVNVESGTEGDCTVTFDGPAYSGFPMGSVVVAKTSSGGQVTLSASDTKTSNNAFKFTLSIKESVKKSLKTGADSIKLTLPDGFEWKTTNAPTTMWGDATNFTYVKDKEELAITVNQASTVASAWEAVLEFEVVNEKYAEAGDVMVKVNGKSTLTPSELKVGKYGDFGVALSAKSTPDVFAGKIEQEIGDIVIKETIGDSLVAGRYITLSLPAGAKWTKVPSSISTSGAKLNLSGNSGSDGNIVKYVITDNGSSAAELKLEDIEVALNVMAPGDLVVTLGGNAGVSGEVVVAKVNLPVTMKAEGATEVVIGSTAQKLGDLIITEAVAGAISDDAPTAASPFADKIFVKLPAGCEWVKIPTITVESGDLKLDLSQVTRSKHPAGTTYATSDYYQFLVIPVERDSNVASTIKITGGLVNVDRTVAEGNMTVALLGGAVLASNSAYANTAMANAGGYVVGSGGMFPQTEAIAGAVGAKVVTPAQSGGRSATFYIGSTIMNVNGQNVIMDAAPYIKAGRTYVPVRYLGDALGATTAWDADTKTVTVTKGDNTVVLVIGSTIAKVNGADVQMDVAPEITGVGRTMLPARYVAEGLGYAVGWNAALQQVVIQ